MALFLHLDAVFTTRQVALKFAIDGRGFNFAQGAAVAVHLTFVGFLRVVYVEEFFHCLISLSLKLLKESRWRIASISQVSAGA